MLLTKGINRHILRPRIVLYSTILRNNEFTLRFRSTKKVHEEIRLKLMELFAMDDTLLLDLLIKIQSKRSAL